MEARNFVNAVITKFSISRNCCGAKIFFAPNVPILAIEPNSALAIFRDPVGFAMSLARLQFVVTPSFSLILPNESVSIYIVDLNSFAASTATATATTLFITVVTAIIVSITQPTF